jgi:ribA/ribD-fused uncharacterized protein
MEIVKRELKFFYVTETIEDEEGKIREEKVVGFVGGPFSNFHPSPFVLDIPDRGTVEFGCVEQAFHYIKCIDCGDLETADKVLKAQSPKDQKKFGREARNFDPVKWDEISYDVMVKCLIAKFTSNDGLKNLLLETGNARIYEEAHYCKVWGTGRTCNEAFTDSAPITGKNKLGLALMEVREKLRAMAST